MPQFVFVSFDISSHAAVRDHGEQVRRIATLNDLVGSAIRMPENVGSLWASGGDGGHIAFTAEGAVAGVPRIIRELRKWSLELATALRVVAHVGTCSTVRGADGRTQLVGDGINLCGSLLEVASDKAIIVTASFAELFEKIPGSGLKFHDPRHVYLKHFRMTRVFLCSLEGGFESCWMPLHRSDRILLTEAMEARAPWDVIYYARRLIQVNSDDPTATEVIANAVLNNYGELTPQKVGRSISRFSLFSTIDPASFLSFVTAAELVERRDGEVLCNQDDIGDTMFILLRGELALGVNSAEVEVEGQSGTNFAEDLTFGPGGIVGELAVSLKTKRTATLQAIGDTSLLSFSYQNLVN
jgi:hypothetical protein